MTLPRTSVGMNELLGGTIAFLSAGRGKTFSNAARPAATSRPST